MGAVLMAYPFTRYRYSTTSYEDEMLAQEVRRHIPLAVFILLIVMVSVLSFNLVTARHRIADLEGSCQTP